MVQCRNCDTPFDGAYCPVCGQKDIELERPVSQLLGDIITETFDLDGRAWRTIKTLLARPGVLTSEFLAGRRQKYSPPLRLYLVVSVTFFLWVAWIAGQGLLLDLARQTEQEAAIQAQFMSDDLPRMMFILLPIFALLLKLIFPRRLYFDHIIFSIHLHSAAYIVLALMLPLEEVATGQIPALIVQLVLTVYLFGYVIMSLHRVYDTTWLATSAKSMVLLFGYMIVVSMAIETTSSFQILAD